MKRKLTPTIFADHGERAKFQPYRRTVQFQGLPTVLRAPLEAAELWIRSRLHRGPSVFVTYGGLTGFALAITQAVFAGIIEPRTHVMFDLLLERRRRGLLGYFDRLKMHAFRRSGVCAVVWGADDGQVFAREYQLPESRFQFHPYHTTLDDYDLEASDGGYIFAGGNFGRDYPTLLAALRKIDYPVFIATQNPAIKDLARDLQHVEVCGVTPREFREKLARCTFLAEAHPADFIRTAGHQTFLNAMKLGKPIVMADLRSAVGYIDDGIEGRVVPAGDADALALAIEETLADQSCRSRMTTAGLHRVTNPIYTTLVHMQSIYNLALRLEYDRLKIGADREMIELYGPAESGVKLAMSR
jgi:glycosyltransferase involved in cell wall biosynthesis